MCGVDTVTLERLDVFEASLGRASCGPGQTVKTVLIESAQPENHKICL